jgi:hypothetical protein
MPSPPRSLSLGQASESSKGVTDRFGVEVRAVRSPAKDPSSAIELESRLTRIRCADPWTDDRARAWWAAHAPDVVAQQTTS